MATRDLADEVLVQLTLAGDDSAARTLFERHRKRLLSRFGRQLGIQARVLGSPEDIAQDALAAAFTRLATFENRGPRSFQRWLGRIASNKFNDQLRRYGREPEKTDLGTVLLRMTARDDGPWEQAYRRERRAALQVAIEALSERHRATVKLIENGQNFAEAGRLLAEGGDMVRRRFERARTKVRHAVPCGE